MSSSGAVASVCAGLDELASVDAAALPDRVLRDELVALVRARRQVDAQIWARTALFEARDLARVDGCRDVRAFLHTFADQPATATALDLARGRLLRELPRLAGAAARGGVGLERLRVVTQLAKDVGVAKLAYLDTYLTDAVTTATVGEFHHACEVVRAELCPDGRPPDEGAEHERRHLSIFRHGPHVKIRGLLDLAGGAAVLAALDAVLTPPGAGDERTPTQARADALGELARRSLDTATLPEPRRVSWRLGYPRLVSSIGVL